MAALVHHCLLLQGTHNAVRPLPPWNQGKLEKQKQPSAGADQRSCRIESMMMMHTRDNMDSNNSCAAQRMWLMMCRQRQHTRRMLRFCMSDDPST